MAAWPVPVHEVVLIGHSMGGLVARSACHYGSDSACMAKVRHVFTLGAPHRGAPLERATNAASAALARLPETRPIARASNLRSSGIKDLRYGYLVDECWMDQDCDAFLRDTSREIPFLPTARHYFICATLTRDAGAAAGRIIGDLLVLQPSAWAHEAAGDGRASRSSTTTTWAAPTTSTCSTIRRSSPRCAAAWVLSAALPALRALRLAPVALAAQDQLLR